MMIRIFGIFGEVVLKKQFAGNQSFCCQLYRDLPCSYNRVNVWESQCQVPKLSHLLGPVLRWCARGHTFVLYLEGIG
jgi:hypothetical protein